MIVGVELLLGRTGQRRRHAATSLLQPGRDLGAQLRGYVALNLESGRKMARDMVSAGRFAVAVRHYGLRSLRYHPRKDRLIDRVTRPLQEAANAIRLPPPAATGRPARRVA